MAQEAPTVGPRAFALTGRYWEGHQALPSAKPSQLITQIQATKTDLA